MDNSTEYNFTVDDKNEALKDDIDITVDDDETIAKKVALRMMECKAWHDERVKIANENMALFDGDADKFMTSLESGKYNSKAVKNVIFLTIRNMVGLATDNPPLPDVSPSKETPQSIEKARIIAGSIQNDMVRTKFNDRLGHLLFDTWIKSDSFIHWFWNYEINDVDFMEIKTEDLSVANGATSVQDAEYIIYHPYKNRTWWKANYGEQYQNIKFEAITKTGKASEAGRGHSARLISYWQNDIRVEQVMGKEGTWIVLKKDKNPYYEWRSSDEQIMQWAEQLYPEVAQMAEQTGVTDTQGIQTMITDPQLNPDAQMGDLQKFVPILNFLADPRKPFIQIPSIKLMGDMYSKNLIAQIREVFVSLTMKKRQIADNIRGANTKLVVDSGSFTEKQIASITDQPLQVIRADFSNTPKPLYFAETTNFPIDMVLMDMHDDTQYIDDVFGHHDISRGAGNAGTLGQDQMNAQSDRTPIRYQVRSVENAIVELWQGWIQLKKMFYTDVHYIKMLGATDGMETNQLMSHDIEEGIDPMLQPMSTATMTKVEKANQSLQLYQLGALDPLTLFTDLGKKDAQAQTNRLINWTRAGIISADDPEKLQADMQNHAITPGDSTENPVERADQENTAMQMGSDVPPTPPELVTIEHVKLHMAFVKDKKNKMEQDAMDNINNHIEADKATLVELTKQGIVGQMGNESPQEQAGDKGAEKPNEQQEA